MTFEQWLYRQMNRDDAIGRLAKLVEDARPKHTGASTFGLQLSRFKNGRGISEESFSDLQAAYHEYVDACNVANRLHEMWSDEDWRTTQKET